MNRSLGIRRRSRKSRTCAELREAYAVAVRRGSCMFQGPERRLVLESVPFAERRNSGRQPGTYFADVELEVPLEYPYDVGEIRVENTHFDFFC